MNSKIIFKYSDQDCTSSVFNNSHHLLSISALSISPEYETVENDWLLRYDVPKLRPGTKNLGKHDLKY